MSVELLLSRIDGKTTQQQILQLKNCLYQMAEQLKFALNNLSADNFSDDGKKTISQMVAGVTPGMTAEQENQYRELKALIIKTSHTVTEFSEEVSRRLESEYVAQSEFGEFRERAEAQLVSNADSLTQYYERTTEIASALQDAAQLFDAYIADTSAYIRTGFLYENDAGVPVYGVEIGQKTTQNVDGQEVEVMSGLMSRFTSNRLSFYQGEAEVAYISNQRLYITDAEITGSLSIGDWLMSTTNGFTLRYTGGN